MDPNLARQFEEHFQKEMAALKAVVAKIKTAASDRAKLMTQQRENENVAEELGLLDDDAEVFKLVGPALVKQELDESRETVKTRLAYIQKELDRVNDSVARLEKAKAGHEEKLGKIQATARQIQQRFIQQQQAAQAKQQAKATSS